MQSKFSIPDTLSWWQMIITWGGPGIHAQPWSSHRQGGSEAGPWSARKLWHLKVASLETKHLGGSAGPCHGHGGDWSLDSSKLGASNIQLSLLDWIFPELQGTHFLESFTFAGKSKVSCRFSLKEHVRDAVFSLNSFSGLWIMWACCWKWVVHPHDFMANTAWKAKCTICGQTRIGSVCQLKLVWCQKLWLKETRRCCQPTECCPVWVSPFIYTWLESRWGCRGSQRFTQILQSQEDTSDTSASFHAGPEHFWTCKRRGADMRGNWLCWQDYGLES